MHIFLMMITVTIIVI